MDNCNHIDDSESENPENTFEEPRTLSREERLAALKEKAKAYAREQRKKAYAVAKAKMQLQREALKQKKHSEKLKEREERRQKLGQSLKRGHELVTEPQLGSQSHDAVLNSGKQPTQSPPIERSKGHLALVKN